MCSHVECVLYHTRSQKEGYTRTRMCSHIECVLYTTTLRLAMWHAWRARHVARLAGASGAPSNPLVGIENTFDRAQGGAKQSTCLSPSPNLAAPARRRAAWDLRVPPLPFGGFGIPNRSPDPLVRPAGRDRTHENMFSCRMCSLSTTGRPRSSLSGICRFEEGLFKANTANERTHREHILHGR